MYDELVKRLRTECTLPFQTLQLMREAADAIEQLTADLERSKEWEAFWEKEANEALKKFQTTVASMPRWIPVTERLPKTDDIVIVAIHDDSGDTPYDVTNVGFYLDVFPLGVWVVENERCNYITHWMPLPQPPKEVEEV